MSITLRPRTNVQRDLVAQALKTYIASTGAVPTVVSLDASLFAEERTAYEAARAAYLERSSAAEVASQAAHEADADFDRDLRLFSISVRDEAGRGTPRVVADLLGGVLASDLVRRTHREEVTRVNGLFVRLAARTDISYGEARAEALRASTDALKAAMLLKEEADRALLGAGVAFTSAKSAFDTAYGKLLRAAKAMLDETTFRTVFPRFVTSDPASTETAVASETAGAAVDTGSAASGAV